MANPPITIGPFTNVPAPGSPIRSDWSQSISSYVAAAAYRYPDLATLKAASPPVGTFGQIINDPSYGMALRMSDGWYATRTHFDQRTSDAGGLVSLLASAFGFANLAAVVVAGAISFPGGAISGGWMLGRIAGAGGGWDGWVYQITSGGTWALLPNTAVSWTYVARGRL
jgi:hypothetical protein